MRCNSKKCFASEFSQDDRWFMIPNMLYFFHVSFLIHLYVPSSLDFSCDYFCLGYRTFPTKWYLRFPSEKPLILSSYNIYKKRLLWSQWIFRIAQRMLKEKRNDFWLTHEKRLSINQRSAQTKQRQMERFKRYICFLYPPKTVEWDHKSWIMNIVQKHRY